MIIDKINNWKYYFQNPIFEEIFTKLYCLNQETPIGNYFKNEHFYFKVMTYQTMEEPSVIESHLKEVDIQIILSGSEKIKLYDFNDVQITRPYSIDDDCQFYRAINSAHSEVILKPKTMAVFFQQDIHHPQFFTNNRIENVKKIVIKVNETFFTS